MNIRNVNRLFVVVASFCSIALLISLLAQFAFHHRPCFLCNVQRGCYFAIAVAAVCGYLLQVKKNFFRLLLGLLPVSAIVSAFHLFVQYGMIKDFCTRHSSIKADVFDLILSQPTMSVLPSCAIKSWTLLGQPLSFYNLMIFAGGALFLFSKRAVDV